MKLEPGFCAQPAEEIAHAIALGHLAEAKEASERLRGPGNGEALHDFRVGIRRLRSCLKAYKDLLYRSISKKRRRRLKAVARDTTAGRDTEVQLEWLRNQAAELTSRQRVGLAWQLERLEARQGQAERTVRDEVLPAFDTLQPELEERLRCFEVKLTSVSAHRETFGELTARLALAQHEMFRERVAAVRSPSDDEEAHQARIGCKQLRYLLEPLRDQIEGARSAVEQLKALQDTLGELHDTVVLAAEVGRGLEQAAAERAKILHELVSRGEEVGIGRAELRKDPRTGLLALARAVAHKKRSCFDAFGRAWQEQGDGLAERIGGIAKDLVHRAAGGRVHTRRYLLGALPDHARTFAPRAIEERWVGEGRIEESLRRGADGPSLVRTVRIREGTQTLEGMETVQGAPFEALWKAAQSRVRYLEYEVPDEVTWRIGVHAERIVIACASGPRPESLRPPAWMEPLVVREIANESPLAHLLIGLDQADGGAQEQREPGAEAAESSHGSEPPKQPSA